MSIRHDDPRQIGGRYRDGYWGYEYHCWKMRRRKCDPVRNVVAMQTLDTFKALQERIQDALQRWGVPGVAVGILHDGQEYTAGFGVTSVENPLPVDADTLMQIGSITKTFTTMAVMRLVDAGVLELDRPMRSYLPELRMSSSEATSGLTLKHLLTHTGGFVGDDLSEPGGGDDALACYATGMAELAQLTPPGELWSYCNWGFCLAGRVIEVVTGKPCEVAVRELIRRDQLWPKVWASARQRIAGGRHWAAESALALPRGWGAPSRPTGGGGLARG